MKNFFEVSGEDITALSDSDLRELVGKLVEADFRKVDLPTNRIFWGGHQDAPDGGFDVVVDVNFDAPHGSYIMSSYTGFQVKRPKMPPSEIRREMLISGRLKPALKNLIDIRGAYLIVSSQDSCAKETALEDRINMIQECFNTEKGGEIVKIDFLDRDRLATWVNSYSGLITWVLSKNNKNLLGWKPYQNWSYAPNGVDEEYLVSDDISLKQSWRTDSDGMTTIDAICCLRDELRQKRSSIRLVGLSGVGKTRLVQALFDTRVGEEPLNPNLVIYTDISDDPDPDPKHLLTQLIVQDYEGYVIVDNCSRALHDSLTKIIRGNGKISLLTVEYDVREQLPPETEVFIMEPVGNELIEKLLVRQFKLLGELNAKKIAECSGGNYRVAMSIAETVKQGESLATLRDELIFDRIFRQSNDSDTELLRAAEVLSLLYSFNSSESDKENSELSFLGGLIGKSGIDMHIFSSEMERRHLIQKRSVWRAVLPHAIANHLAKSFLAKYPVRVILSKILDSGSDRVIISFSRRLGYLDSSKEAVEIVESILDSSGWLGNKMDRFNELELKVFQNISPVSPSKVLDILEELADKTYVEGENFRDHYNTLAFAKILFHIAYEERFFSRATTLLFELALARDDTGNMNSPLSIIMNLFQCALSGTHATVEVRCGFLEDKIRLDKGQEGRFLSLKLLSTALNARSLYGRSDYSFGAKTRDYGYLPKTYKEQKQWYRSFLDLALKSINDGLDEDNEIRRILAESFGGIWNIGCHDELLEITEDLLLHGSWLEGWCAVHRTMMYDWDKQSKNAKLLLKRVSDSLKPSNEKDLIRVYISGARVLHFDHIVDDPDFKGERISHTEMESKAITWGKSIAHDISFVEEIATDLVISYNTHIYSFGKGLALSKTPFEKLWTLLRKAFISTEKADKHIRVLDGMLAGIHSKSQTQYNKLLDQLEQDDVLVKYLPKFQIHGGYDPSKIERLHRIIDRGCVNAWHIKPVLYRNSFISDKDLIALLFKLEKENDVINALDLLQIRFFDIKKGVYYPSKILIDYGIVLLKRFKFDESYGCNRNIDHWLASVAQIVFADKQREEDALSLCVKMTKMFNEHDFFHHYYGELLSVLIRIQPNAFLDGWVDRCTFAQIRRATERFDNYPIENTLSEIDVSLLFDWMEGGDDQRCIKLASMIKMFGNSKKSWTETALALLKKNSRCEDVLKIFVMRLRPSSWSGSLANILEKNIGLLKQLKKESINEEILETKIVYLEKLMIEERKCEKDEASKQYSSFE